MLSVAITLFRRPALTRTLFAALHGCYGAKNANLFISCDYDDRHKDACDEVIAIAEAQDFCEARVTVNRPEPLGIDLNMIYVMGEAFKSSEFVLSLQDDCLPSPDALCYFEQAGERFGGDPRVVTISGYNRTRTPAASIEPYRLGFKPTFNPWGYLTWADRWERLLGNGGARYRAETGEECNNLLDTWLCQQLAPGEGMIYPELSRISLNGWEDATHQHSREYHGAHEVNRHCWAGLIGLPEPTIDNWYL